MSAAKDMTRDQKVDVIALGALMARVAASPGGKDALAGLVREIAGLELIGKNALADLRARANGTTLETETKT